MRNPQKLCKHGSSVSVSIPRHFLYHLNWVQGQSVMVEILADGQGLLVRLPRYEDFGPVRPPTLVRDTLEPPTSAQRGK